MSFAIALLEQLKASGLTVSVDGEHIDIEGPPAALDAMPVDELRAHKAEIIKVLTCVRATPPKPAAPTIDDVAERIGAWLKVDDNPPRPCSRVWRDLADKTSDFSLSVWAYPAGWGDGALFAIDEGLIPEKLRRGLHLMKIDADAATVMTGKGELEHFRRPRTTQPPWWQDPRVAAHHNTPAGEQQQKTGRSSGRKRAMTSGL